ncbi:MAG: hypothetical protein SH847_05180 [Roseiflexaceae bacterium]|nr:hypothetical protein [Roseiflexaceae bacterium]
MQRVNQRVSPSYFELPTPRPFPFDALSDLLIDHLFEPFLRNMLDPLVVATLIVWLAMIGFQAIWYLQVAAFLLIILRLWGRFVQAIRQFRDEIALLQHGLMVRAHILRMRPHRTILGEIEGANLDCAIAVAPRRTYIGSIWLSDGAEAVQVTQRSRIDVICLPRAPGTWRVVENLHSEVRYDRSGPIVHVPDDV